jgi:hypothetical protein
MRTRRWVSLSNIASIREAALSSTAAFRIAPSSASREHTSLTTGHLFWLGFCSSYSLSFSVSCPPAPADSDSLSSFTRLGFRKMRIGIGVHAYRALLDLACEEPTGFKLCGFIRVIRPYPQNGGSSKGPGTFLVCGACADTTRAVGLSGIAPGIAPASSLPRLRSIGSAAERYDVRSRIKSALTRSRTTGGALCKAAMIASKTR